MNRQTLTVLTMALLVVCIAGSCRDNPDANPVGPFYKMKSPEVVDWCTWNLWWKWAVGQTGYYVNWLWFAGFCGIFVDGSYSYDSSDAVFKNCMRGVKEEIVKNAIY